MVEISIRARKASELKPRLAQELSGVFDLDKKGSFSAFSDNTIKKAEKFAKLQMTALGCAPQTVKAIKSNDHFVLCTASVDTSDFTQVEVSVPVQVTNGIPSLPTHFVQDNGLVKLNKENKARPFCSEKCKLLDFGNWASETNKISRPIQSEDFYED